MQHWDQMPVTTTSNYERIFRRSKKDLPERVNEVCAEWYAPSLNSSFVMPCHGCVHDACIAMAGFVCFSW
jgi:hypothetical protein